MECCSKITQLTDQDRKALRRWLEYEHARGLEHTCLGALSIDRIDPFEAWLTVVKGEKYAKRIVKRMKTAARRQGAIVPSHLMTVELDSFIPPEILAKLDGKETTACRHFIRYQQESGHTVDLASITPDEVEHFRTWLFRQPSPGIGQKYQLMAAFRRYATAYAGLPEPWAVRRSRSVHASRDVVSIESHKLVKPYLEYLRQQWAPSTSKSLLRSYETAVTEFLEIVASHYDKPLLALTPTEFFCAAAIEKWVASKPSGNPWTVDRAVRGFLKFWSSDGVEQETLLECLRLVEAIRPKKRGDQVRNVDPAPETPMSRRVSEYVQKLRVRGFHRKAEAAALALRLFFAWSEEQSLRLERPEQLTGEIINGYIRHLIRSYDNWLTTQHYLSMCGDFWRWLHYRGELPWFREDMLPRTKAYRIKPRKLTESQLRMVIRIIQEQNASDYIRKRDLALVTLGLTTAARAVELQRLTFADLDLETGWVRYVTRKSKIRTVPLVPVAARALREYLEVRKRGATPEDDRFVFLSDVGAFGRRMGRSAIRTRFKRYRDLAGIPDSVGNYHVFRHTCAANLAEEGTHPEHIRELLGHETISATNAYLHGHWNVADTLEIPTLVTVRGEANVLQSR